jgi:DNA (cytosine-5)-methyltransferase 1
MAVIRGRATGVNPPTVVGLFAGIGGIERGLTRAGFESALLCEIDPGAVAVLRRRLPGIPIDLDIRKLRSLPVVDVVAAGFPCQDLSQAGRTRGISGIQSGLVDHAFRLVRRRRGGPRWLLLENVPFMLQLDRGRAMHHLTETLEDMGYAWAYRVVDARAFGLPQRRQRVVLLASRTEDPRTVLFSEAVDPRPDGDPEKHACGFYWTEGSRGLGWAVNAVPTLKGGSALGIASPPAVRMASDRSLRTPGIEDAERLQGFPAGWTEPSVTDAGTRPGHRWKLVGNAVSVPFATWVGDRLRAPGDYDPVHDRLMRSGESWPSAAWGAQGQIRVAEVSTWPVRRPYRHLESFLRSPNLLSVRATAGFLRRAEASSLRFVDGFLDDVQEHLSRMREYAA